MLEAEIWGIYLGLVSAWNSGGRNVLVRSDSQEAIQEVEWLGYDRARIIILHHVTESLRRDWVVRFNHVNRERNRVANCMAKLVDRSQMEYVRNAKPHLSVVQLLLEDNNGSLG
ncbi:hypothetical protein F3Y22_tig00110270pilonHSYRG00189 [Hibiscus syriacus]|uniref:RNase H type-1 domain-containing protein n=1 Tax=Hibiscus syriacus TaxID=106335 RepID=A0A6A3B6N0_HIBSY|nr:hypothetical protein F3Y22_tig00110270pilonHSYRG00189 [Hibiscus syriacus]